MKKTSYLLLICFLLGNFCLNAQLTNKRNLSETIYSGTASPTDEGWAELKLDETVNAIAGQVLQEVESGALKLKSVNQPNQYTQLGWYKVNPEFDPTVGYTIEIKAKINNATEYGAFNFQGFDKNGDGFRIGIYNNSVVESTNPLAATNVLTSATDNTDDFHIYRIAVTPEKIVYVYRDDQQIGNFTLNTFYYDNIVTNGGFEDVNTKDENATQAPDYVGNGWTVNHGTFQRSDNASYLSGGAWGLFADNENGLRSQFTYRDIPLKAGAKYDVSFWSKVVNNPSQWRDMNVWLNAIDGTDSNIKRFVNRQLNINGESYNTQKEIAGSDQITKMIFDSPTSSGTAYSHKAAFDNFLVTEQLPVLSRIPSGVTNLFPNGDFEDETAALEYVTTGLRTHTLWGGDTNTGTEGNGRVRLQNTTESARTGPYWSHNGNYALRYETVNNASNNLEYEQLLEPNKTYTLSFWYHGANDYVGLILSILNGDQELWNRQINKGDAFPLWENKIITFTTTDENHTLKIQGKSTNVNEKGIVFFDDFVLFEGEPLPEAETVESYLFFGKSTGVETTDVEIAYVAYDLTGAYGPEGAVDPIPQTLAIEGTAVAESAEPISMKKFGNYFELYTSLQNGDYSFSDGTQGGTVTEAGVYRIRANYSTIPATVTQEKVDRVYMWAILNNKTIAELSYAQNSAFTAENVITDLADWTAGWNETRYRIRVVFDGNKTESYGPKGGVNFVLLENFGTWDNPYDIASKYKNGAPFNLTVNFSVEDDYSFTIEDYIAPFPTSLSIKGTALKDYEATEEVAMKKYDDYYELYTSLQIGDYSFSDATAGGSVTEAGVYRIKADYTQRPTAVMLEKIQKVYMWAPASQKIVAELPYTSNSVFRCENIAWNTAAWSGDDKYRIRIDLGSGNDAITETYGPKDNVNFVLVGNAQWGPSDYNYVPTGYVDNGKLFNAIVDLSASEVYTHTLEDGDNSSSMDEIPASEVKVYPTAATEQITIVLPDNGFTTTIISISGQILFNSSTTSDSLTINVSDLSRGMYIINIEQNGSHIATKRFVKL